MFPFLPGHQVSILEVDHKNSGIEQFTSMRAVPGGISVIRFKNLFPEAAEYCPPHLAYPINFKFQDAVFKDLKWDKEGNASEILWTTNFKGTTSKDLKDTKNYTIELILKLMPKNDSTSTFKISSISIK
jgi:hypothetical protein